MTKLKTTLNRKDVSAFLAGVSDAKRKKDALATLALMKKATGMKPMMWGTSIVGFGKYHYKSERSAQEGDWPLTGFSPRKQALTIYIMPGFKQYGALLKKLGPHTKSVSCLYIKDLSKIHLPTLATIVRKSVADMKKRYG